MKLKKYESPRATLRKVRMDSFMKDVLIQGSENEMPGTKRRQHEIENEGEDSDNDVWGDFWAEVRNP